MGLNLCIFLAVLTCFMFTGCSKEEIFSHPQTEAEKQEEPATAPAEEKPAVDHSMSGEDILAALNA